MNLLFLFLLFQLDNAGKSFFSTFGFVSIHSRGLFVFVSSAVCFHNHSGCGVGVFSPLSSFECSKLSFRETQWTNLRLDGYFEISTIETCT